MLFAESLNMATANITKQLSCTSTPQSTAHEHVVLLGSTHVQLTLSQPLTSCRIYQALGLSTLHAIKQGGGQELSWVGPGTKLGGGLELS